jgi:Radical SAM superfamily/Iron-sulfur cluster-binding domain
MLGAFQPAKLRALAAKFQRSFRSKLSWLKSHYREKLRPSGHALRYFLGFSKAPDRLYLEFVNLCNANCVFCAYQYDTKPKAILSNNDFRHVVDQYQDMGGKHVGLSPLVGELFVDTDALAKIQYLQTKKFDRVHTFTNASLFHRFGIENILRSGLTAIHISIPPLEESAYKAIYRTSNYRRVRENVTNLLRAFSNISDKTVKTVDLEFRSDRPLQEIQSLPDYIEFIQPYLTDGVHQGVLQDFDIWGGAIDSSNLVPGMGVRDTKVFGPKRIPCWRIFMLQVLADGTIRQCGCRIDPKAKRDEMELGHISHMTLQEAYRSPRARKNIWSFVSGNYLELCKHCTMYDIVR